MKKLLLFFVILHIPKLQSQTKTWTGTTSADWNHIANWMSIDENQFNKSLLIPINSSPTYPATLKLQEQHSVTTEKPSVTKMYCCFAAATLASKSNPADSTKTITVLEQSATLTAPARRYHLIANPFQPYMNANAEEANDLSAFKTFSRFR